MKRHTHDICLAEGRFAFQLGRTRRIATTAVTLLCASAMYLPAFAATTIWQGSSSGGDFNTASNWTAGVPGTSATDDAFFNSATNVNGTVTFSANATHNRTYIQNTAGTTTFDVGPYMWTMNGFALVGAAGATDAPTVKVIGGKVQSLQILLGGEVTNTRPSVELTGPTTQWHTTFTSAGPQVGLGADGSSILVHNGAKLSGVGQAIVGLTGAKNGSLTVSGVGSSLEFGNYIGAGHTAGATNATNNKVEVLAGATAKSAMIYMAITAGATDNLIRVSGAGSKLNLVGTTPIDDGRESRVGMAGINNTLRIEAGGAITGTNTFLIGRDATSNAGNQLVIDGGSLTGTGVEVRRGLLSITNGTIELSEWYDDANLVFKGGGLLVPLASGAGSASFKSGKISSVNASVTNGSAFTVGDGGTLSATYFMKKDQAGNLATHTFASGLALASNGILSGSGNIVGNVSGAAGAIVDVGASAGLIKAGNDWSNAGLSLDLEVGNLATHPAVGGKAYDELRVAGAFTHGGSVAIDVAGFVPGSGFVKDLKLVGWGSQIGSTAATAVSFVGGPALPYEFRSDGLYLTDVAYSFVPEPTAMVLCLMGFSLLASTTRRRFGATR